MENANSRTFPSHPVASLFVCLLYLEIARQTSILSTSTTHGEFSLLEFVYTPTTSSSQTRGWAQSLSAPQWVQSEILLCFYILPCMASLHPARSFQVSPAVWPLTGSRRTSWVLGNTTSPYSSPLICATARLLSLREGGCLMVDGSSSGSFDAFIKGFTKAGRGLDFFWPVCLCLSSRERKEVKLFLFVPQPGPALWPAKEHVVDVLIFTF